MSNALPEQAVSFKFKQAEFSAFIRDPENNPPPADVKAPRMHIYRELFFNNINSFLSSNFPVLHQLLAPSQWLALVQDFFSRHACKTPYFSEIPEEFIHYLQYEREPVAGDLPFMLELAHYEWVEMALSISRQEAPVADMAFAKNPHNYPIAISSLAWPLLYQYPVQRISPDFQPQQAPEQPTPLVVYRDAAFELHFLLISPMTFRLLQILQEKPGLFMSQWLQQLIEESSHPSPQILKTGGEQIIRELAEKGIIHPARISN